MKTNYKIVLALLCVLTIPFGYLIYKNRKPAPYVGQVPAYQMPESNPEQVKKVIANLKRKPTPFTVPQTVELVSMLYNELGPRIGCHLVEPNTLLALAGFRGQGNFLTHYLTQEEKIRFAQINNQLKALGINFEVNDDVQDELVDIFVGNLKGLEYATGLSKLPFVKKFKADTGLMGYKDWFQHTNNEAKKYFQEQYAQSPFSQDSLSHLMIGLVFGYPDQALLDLYNSREDYPAGKSEIPFSNYYDNPEPNFSFLPEHKNDPGIVHIVNTWGNFLQTFYKSPWQQKLQNDSEFKRMRKLEDEMHDRWFKRKRLNR